MRLFSFHLEELVACPVCDKADGFCRWKWRGGFVDKLEMLLKYLQKFR
jgi:hypothetical protein